MWVQSHELKVKEEVQPKESVLSPEMQSSHPGERDLAESIEFL